MAKGSGGGSVIMKCVLIVVNIFFGLIGFALLAAGVFLKLGQSVYGSFLDSITESLPSVAKSTGLPGSTSGEGATLDISAIIGGVSIALIVIGVFLFAMALLACIGACCDVTVVFIIYCIIMTILVIAQIVLLGMYAGGYVTKQINGLLTRMIHEKYVGIDDFSTESLLLNVVMIQFKCCGANDYKDFNSAKKWKRTRTITVGGVSVPTPLITPIACCKQKGTFPDVQVVSDTCAKVPTDLTNNWNTGCTDELMAFLNQYRNIIYGVMAGIIVFQLVMIIFVICLLVIKNKEKNKVM